MIQLKNLLDENNKWKESWEIELKKIGEHIECCLHCWRSNFTVKKKIKPPYKCANWGCLKSFEKPFIRGDRQSKEYYKLRHNFMRKVVEIYYAEIKKVYHKYVEFIVQNYLSMENVLVLCEKCHYRRRRRFRVYMKDYYYMDLDILV